MSGRDSIAEAFRKGAMLALGRQPWPDADDYFSLIGIDYANGKVLPEKPVAPADHAGLVEAAQWIAEHRRSIEMDVASAHSGRGNGASEWMREDDRDFRSDLHVAFDCLADALASSAPPAPKTVSREGKGQIAWGLFNPATGKMDHRCYQREEGARAGAMTHSNRWRKFFAVPLFLYVDEESERAWQETREGMNK